MSIDTAVGVITGVVFGVAGLVAAKTVWSNRQRQKIDRGGTGYQAGGDIRIGKDEQ